MDKLYSSFGKTLYTSSDYGQTWDAISINSNLDIVYLSLANKNYFIFRSDSGVIEGHSYNSMFGYQSIVSENDVLLCTNRVGSKIVIAGHDGNNVYTRVSLNEGLSYHGNSNFPVGILSLVPNGGTSSAIFWNGTKYVVLGPLQDGAFNTLTSPDGFVWTHQTAATPLDFRNVYSGFVYNSNVYYLNKVNGDSTSQVRLNHFNGVSAWTTLPNIVYGTGADNLDNIYSATNGTSSILMSVRDSSTGNYRLLRSTNGGTSWTTIIDYTAGSNPHYISSILRVNSNYVLEKVYTTSNTQTYSVSTNDGVTFTEYSEAINKGLPVVGPEDLGLFWKELILSTQS
ncbi:sortilin [Caudoviricetes sp.]|nr:sortilin [Caudoviricetes sp.]